LTHGFVAGYGAGAAVYHVGAGAVVVSGVTISDNHAGFGGGIFTSRGSLEVRDSTIANNSASHYYGGIGAYKSPVTIVNSTVSGNSQFPQVSPTGAGGIGVSRSESALTIENSTIADNYGYIGNGGIASYRALVTLKGTIVAGNIGGGPGPDVYTFNAPAVVENFSLVGNTSGFTLDPASGDNLNGQDPMLGALGPNGGPTPTMKPAAGSPVVDKGKDFTGGGLDQRGLPVYDDLGLADASDGDGRDIGAVELQAADLAPSFTLVPSSTVLDTGSRLDVNGHLYDASGTPLVGKHVLVSVVSGPNAGKKWSTTTQSVNAGHFKFGLVSTKPNLGNASDEYRACYDANSSATCDPGEATGTVSVEWVASRRMIVGPAAVVPADAGHKVTLKGTSLYCESSHFPLKATVQYSTNKNVLVHQFVMTLLTHRECDTPTGAFTSITGLGDGTLDGSGGYSFTYTLTDNGEPGKTAGDTVDITVKDGMDNTVFAGSGRISSGELDAYSVTP
jgi:hypothetical protein